MDGTGCGGEAMDWKHLFAYITGTVDQELLLRNEYLVTENRILRKQITGRVRLTEGRAWRYWGSRRYRDLLNLNVEVRIPALEDTGQRPVQRPHARLQQHSRPLLRPLHLLLFAESLAHHCLHCRLHKPGRDRLAVAIALSVIRDHMSVVPDVRAQCRQRLDQSRIPGIDLAERRHRALQSVDLAQRFVHLTMPQ